MTYIHWEKPFYLDIRTLSTSKSPQDFYTIPVPTYGNYGGPGYTQGDFGENPLEQPKRSEKPLDALDRQFHRHDVACALAGNDPAAQVAADLALIQNIAGLSDEKLADPEASLYAGLATLVFIGQVAVSGTREQFRDARLALPDALDNITSGLAGLPFGERYTASLWLAQATELIESDGKTNILDSAINILDDQLPFYGGTDILDRAVNILDAHLPFF
jgi:hypothetical protein